jgi:hypothetical protein
MVSTATMSAAVGTALVFQLPGVNQSVDVAPVQLVCAWAGKDAAPNAPANKPLALKADRRQFPKSSAANGQEEAPVTKEIIRHAYADAWQ